jgi:ABC-2 type transport system permease protein
MASRVWSLIRKDYSSILSEKMTAIVFLVLFTLSAVMTSSLSFAGLGMAFFSISVYVLNVFTLEEKFHTERFFASLPLRRRDIVLARYGGVMAIMVAFFVLAFLWNAVFILTGKSEARPIPLGYCATVILAEAGFTSLSLPLYFKFGMAAKARTVTMLLVVLPMTLVGALYGIGNAGASLPVMKDFIANPYPQGLPLALLLIGAAILLWGASIKLAVLFYSKRDL